MTDIGPQMNGEKGLLEIEDEQNYVLSLAASVGVKTLHNLGSVRSYAKHPTDSRPCRP